MKHKYNIGQLVELDNGVRLFVIAHHEYDDPYYGLGFILGGETEIILPESELSPIHNPVIREPLKNEVTS